MRLLTTGASGLLGTRLCQLAEMRNNEVYAAYCEHVPLYGIPLQLSILDSKALQHAISKTNPHAVVHAAALTDVDKCEVEKELAWKTNVDATLKLVRLCKEHDIFLLYVSTDYVFDGKRGMYKETDNPAPINYYGLTKLKGEEAVRTLENHCIARASVIYGSTPSTGKINFALWLLDKIKKNEQVRIVTDQWNSPTLNTSMAEMILEILEKRKNGTFHLAGATRLSRYEFALHLAETFKLDAKSLMPTQLGDIKWIAPRPRDSSLDVKKADKMLDNKPIRVNEALEKMRDEIT